MSNPDSRQLVLDLLRKQGNISGKQLGEAAGISRSAVWKHIGRLKEQGYNIVSTPGEGYKLLSSPDRLLPSELLPELNTRVLGREVFYYQELSSTQEKAVELAKQGYPEGTLIIAEKQVSGKGRLGRNWESHPGSVCVSLIFRPNMRPEDILHFPLATGIAAARTIRNLTGYYPGLKWPNDILLSGRKLGGILTELAAEPDKLHYLVIGIGININTPKPCFSEQIQSTATSLVTEYGQEFSRLGFLQVLLREMEAIHSQYQEYGFTSIREDWKALNVTLGRKVTIQDRDKVIQGTAQDINLQGGLVVNTNSGEYLTVTSGDVADQF